MEGAIILVEAHDRRFEGLRGVVHHRQCGSEMHKLSSLDLSFDGVANRLLLRGRVVLPQRFALQPVEMRDMSAILY